MRLRHYVYKYTDLHSSAINWIHKIFSNFGQVLHHQIQIVAEIDDMQYEKS